MNFELKYNKHGENDLFSITFTLESNDGNVKFVVGEDVKFSVLECKNYEYKICKGGYDYLDCIEIETDINLFVEKLKKREFPCEFIYKYEYSHSFEMVRDAMSEVQDGFKIIVTPDKINVNDRGFLPINNVSIESIIHFFEYLYEIKNKIIKEYTLSEDEDEDEDWIAKYNKER